jgi:hypothetical protein
MNVPFAANGCCTTIPTILMKVEGMSFDHLSAEHALNPHLIFDSTYLRSGDIANQTEQDVKSGIEFLDIQHTKSA